MDMAREMFAAMTQKRMPSEECMIGAECLLRGAALDGYDAASLSHGLKAAEEHRAEHNSKCEKCGGSGLHKEASPMGLVTEIRCPECRGSGCCPNANVQRSAGDNT